VHPGGDEQRRRTNASEVHDITPVVRVAPRRPVGVAVVDSLSLKTI
jgi:hypothetical protein